MDGDDAMTENAVQEVRIDDVHDQQQREPAEVTRVMAKRKPRNNQNLWKNFPMMKLMKNL